MTRRIAAHKIPLRTKYPARHPQFAHHLHLQKCSVRSGGFQVRLIKSSFKYYKLEVLGRVSFQLIHAISVFAVQRERDSVNLNETSSRKRCWNRSWNPYRRVQTLISTELVLLPPPIYISLRKLHTCARSFARYTYSKRDFLRVRVHLATL